MLDQESNKDKLEVFISEDKQYKKIKAHINDEICSLIKNDLFNRENKDTNSYSEEYITSLREVIEKYYDKNLIDSFSITTNDLRDVVKILFETKVRSFPIFVTSDSTHIRLNLEQPTTEALKNNKYLIKLHKTLESEFK
ncbi:hypothetical protein HPMBJEAJ_00287 [Aeromonas phage avDM6]|nr:hypothetical protein HPMBJEAJ_00287 [Aeromonas phage avDM6]